MKRNDFVLCRKIGVDEPFSVRIMAIAEGYAMVRRKGAMPFCVPLKRLELAVIDG